MEKDNKINEIMALDEWTMKYKTRLEKFEKFWSDSMIDNGLEDFPMEMTIREWDKQFAMFNYYGDKCNES